VAVFRRRESSPGPFRRYSQYLAFVREDFAECCAYCLLHEILAGGREGFELDHFRPKSLPQFASLVNDFYNLYYACHICNSMKRDLWPDPSQEEDGFEFVDLCAEAFSDHFEEVMDGSWVPLSRQAEYTLDKLRLNRAHLVTIRGYLREIAEARGWRPPDWNVPLREQVQRLLAG
jgi:hypothetical protein